VSFGLEQAPPRNALESVQGFWLIIIYSDLHLPDCLGNNISGLIFLTVIRREHNTVPQAVCCPIKVEAVLNNLGTMFRVDCAKLPYTHMADTTIGILGPLTGARE